MKWQIAPAGFIPGVAWTFNRESAFRKWNLCGISNHQQPETGGNVAGRHQLHFLSKYQRQDDPQVAKGGKIYRLEAATD